MNPYKILLPGGAGLVGQNLIPRLKALGYQELVVIDKHPHNLKIVQALHPDIITELADLASPGDWTRHFEDAKAVVMLQAQIGGLHSDAFFRNNELATKNILQAMDQLTNPRLVHISSSVVESVANDMYSESKKRQEQLVIDSPFNCPILRPTLMFGWFDRKHLGWLSRFMQKFPIFPIPGHGRYMRQPLYVGDFSKIIISCIQNPTLNGTYNISGEERLDYIDLIRAVKHATGAKALIVKIPYSLFYVLLLVWAIFDKNPPFTTQQLSALTAKDEFEVIDWQGIFGVHRTKLKDALEETFNHPQYSKIALEF